MNAAEQALRDGVREALLAELDARCQRAYRALADAHPDEFARLLLEQPGGA